MKQPFNQFFAILFILIVGACGKSGNQDDQDKQSEDNQVLYNEIMDIHDEVMPKTEQLYNITKQLKANMKDATTDAEKDLLQNQIDYFDSVNMMMMDWMHEFKPLPDSTDDQTARKYYETHLEKVKLVKEAILTALDKGRN